MAELAGPIVMWVTPQRRFEALAWEGVWGFRDHDLVGGRLFVAQRLEAKGFFPTHARENYGHLGVVKFFSAEINDLIPPPQLPQRGGAPRVTVHSHEVAPSISSN